MIGMRRATRAAADLTPAAEAAPGPATRLPPAAVAAMQRGGAPVETVTLNKIGDFLELDFGRLFTWLRRGMLLGLILAVFGAVAGVAYAVLTPPKYTVSTDILIDPANLQVVPDDLYQQPGQVDNALLNAGSKFRVMTSGNVLSRVVDELNLAEDREFYDPDPGFSLSSLIPGSGDKAEPNPRLAALASLSKRVTAKADEKSFVATLFVSSE
ncbi:MAG: lipopolysaccharide biosynthesis protein, partial [Caulobacteraceae bacterium]